VPSLSLAEDPVHIAGDAKQANVTGIQGDWRLLDVEVVGRNQMRLHLDVCLAGRQEVFDLIQRHSGIPHGDVRGRPDKILVATRHRRGKRLQFLGMVGCCL
jgi:hypothetical protein